MVTYAQQASLESACSCKLWFNFPAVVVSWLIMLTCLRTLAAFWVQLWWCAFSSFANKSFTSLSLASVCTLGQFSTIYSEISEIHYFRKKAWKFKIHLASWWILGENSNLFINKQSQLVGLSAKIQICFTNIQSQLVSLGAKIQIYLSIDNHSGLV